MKNIIIFICVSLASAAVIIYSAEKLGLFNLSAKATSTGTHMVSLLKDKADPDIVLVKVGEYVQFNSKDGKSHEIEKGTGNGYGHAHEHVNSDAGSGNFKADEAYKVQFKKVGIYSFHDHYNPDINITVVAKDK